MKLLVPFSVLLAITFGCSSSKSIEFKDAVTSNAYGLYGQALEAIFSMGLRLQVIMDTSTNENFVVSPLSTTAIIAQMMIGAEGEFREQLHDLLSLPKSTSSFNVTHFSKERNESQILPYAAFHLQLAILIKNLRQRKPGEEFILNLDNALFYNEDADLRTVFTTSLNKMYNTEVTPLDFHKDTKSIINKWASDHTNGLIKTFLRNSLSPNTAALFLNSIYFLAEWETPFADILNTVDNFQVTHDSSVKATFMMGNIVDIPYAETKDYRLVCLPYKNREVGMYLILPNKDHEHKYNIKKFAEDLHPQDLFAALAKLKSHDVLIKMPKLSLSNTLSILEPLKKYAVYEKTERHQPQDANAIDEVVNKVKDFKNFTGPVHDDIILENAARGVPLKVSNIFQQMVFSVNEKGTEAAAVSGGISDYMGGAKTVILNRPFSFFIRHEETQAVIFWGTISNPASN